MFKMVEEALLYYKNAKKWKLIYNYYYISCHRMYKLVAFGQEHVFMNSCMFVHVREYVHTCMYIIIY